MLARIYHWQLWIQGAFASLAILFTTDWVDENGSWWSLGLWIIWIATFFGLIGTTVAQIKHRPNSCVQCIVEVPTDAAWQAKKKIWRLYLYHWQYEYHPIWFGIILMSGMAAIFGIVFVDSYKWLIGGYLALWWCWRFYLDLMNKDHRLLKSFCPYCKGDGEYDPRPERVPDPFGTKNK